MLSPLFFPIPTLLFPVVAVNWEAGNSILSYLFLPLSFTFHGWHFIAGNRVDGLEDAVKTKRKERQGCTVSSSKGASSETKKIQKKRLDWKFLNCAAYSIQWDNFFHQMNCGIHLHHVSYHCRCTSSTLANRRSLPLCGLMDGTLV